MDEAKRRRLAQEAYEDIPEDARRKFMELVREAAVELSEEAGVEITPERVGASANRLATFHTWQLSERFNSLPIVP